MEERHEDYKVELIHKHDDKGEKLSFYKQGDFVDLCAGPHIMSVAPIKAVKLLSCTGAYWGKAEDGKQTVAQYLAQVAKENGAKLSVKKFVRFETGEGLEKKVDDFAAEVAAQAGM